MNLKKVAFFMAGFAVGSVSTDVPFINVPSCTAAMEIISFNTSVPYSAPFPTTQVFLCYDDWSLHLNFTAYGQSSFYVNQSLTTNDDIYNYDVMEAFVYQGTEAPTTYLEFEVAPNNVTYNAFVYNPSTNRSPGDVFDHFFITDPNTIGITSNTTIEPYTPPPGAKGDKGAGEQVWHSEVQIPLALFNVYNGQAKDTQWRMSFFRTIYDPDSNSQTYGAWSVPDQINFHITNYFGQVNFV